MRRKDREIQDREEIDQIIRQCQVCRLALAMDNVPYLVPVSFGYDGRAIYFHTASEGKKIAYFEANPRVCFEFELGVRLARDEQSACNWSFAYESVIGDGAIQEVVGVEKRAHALELIMRQYSDGEWAFDAGQLRQVRVWRIAVDSVTGKRSRQEAV